MPWHCRTYTQAARIWDKLRASAVTKSNRSTSHWNRFSHFSSNEKVLWPMTSSGKSVYAATLNLPPTIRSTNSVQKLLIWPPQTMRYSFIYIVHLRLWVRAHLLHMYELHGRNELNCFFFNPDDMRRIAVNVFAAWWHCTQRWHVHTRSHTPSIF